MRFLRFKFRSLEIEKEYRKIKEANMKSFFKLLLYVLIVFTLIGIVQGIKGGSLSTFTSSALILIISVFLLRYGHKLDRFIDYVLAFMCLALYLNTMISSKVQLDDLDMIMIPKELAITYFYLGFILGIFERIVILELTRIELKVIFSVVSLVVRLCVWRLEDTFSICYQLYNLFICLFVDIRREKNDRSIFLSFYDYREELKKFKNLMVSGLPTNILIVSKDLKAKLFINKYFEETFNVNPMNRDFKPGEWFSTFKIEKDSLSGLDINLLDYDPHGNVNLEQFLDILNEKELLIDQAPNLTFNTKTRMIGSQEDIILETKVFSLLWDTREALAIIMSDVTQQYINLSLKVADNNKDKMIAMLSHELRNPLNGIMGMIQIMEKKVRDDEIHKYLEVCMNSGKLLLNLVNSILDLGQIRNNKLRLNILTGNLRNLLQEIYLLFESQFNHKKLYLKIEIDLDVPKYVRTDLNRLRQVLINLIANALKFTFEGGVRVEVSKYKDQEGYLLFKVKDTGIGIKEEDKKKLFKMYGRLDQPDKKVNIEGVGLGLTISDHLVRLLSANKEDESIRIESVYGEGTALSFVVKTNLDGFNSTTTVDDEENVLDMEDSLYVQENADVHRKMSTYILQSNKESNSSHFQPKEPEMKGSIDNIEQRLSSLHDEDEVLIKKPNDMGDVLLVDDSPFNILVARTLLETLGYAVQTALNGKIAVDTVIKHAGTDVAPYKIIFMDCQMPVMDGFEATTILREMMGSGKIPEIPIVALSANDSEDDQKRCRDAGMCDHLGKPVSEASLKAVLEKYCKRR